VEPTNVNDTFDVVAVGEFTRFTVTGLNPAEAAKVYVVPEMEFGPDASRLVIYVETLAFAAKSPLKSAILLNAPV
jgi:hypothetical protein